MNNPTNKFYTFVAPYGNKVFFRGYINNKRIQKEIDYSPFIFYRSSAISKSDESCWKDFFTQSPLEKRHFSTIKEFKEYVEFNKNHFPLYGTTNIANQFIGEIFRENLIVDSSSLDIGTIDIETDSSDGFPLVELADKEIISIAYHSSRTNEYTLWSLKKCDTHSVVNRCFTTEIELLIDFVSWWSTVRHKNSCDILTGWNTVGYDIPYLIRRLENLFGGEGNKIVSKLSPFGKYFRQISKETNSFTYYVYGIEQLDYLELFKKFGKNTYGEQENYRLDTIAELILGEKKLDYSEYATLAEFYEKNPQKFLEYNIRDVELVVRIEKAIGMIAFATTLAYRAKVNFKHTLGTTQLWEMMIYDHLLSKKLVPQIKFSNNIKKEFEGAFVKQPLLGMKKWIVSFDINSMYPNIMVEKNMSPETEIVGLKAKNLQSPSMLLDNYGNRGWKVDTGEGNDYSVAANGACFSKSRKGIVPEIIEQLYSERIKLKDQMIKLKQSGENLYKDEIAKLNNQQTAIKILLNSNYGAFGNQHFAYFSSNIAEGITATGQMIILVLEKIINSVINREMRNEVPIDYVIAIDTDGVYVDFSWIEAWLKREQQIENPHQEKIVEWIDILSEKVFVKVFEKEFKKIAQKTNSYSSRISIKREVIASSGFWSNKKRYVLNVVNNEGVVYDPPKKKIMGIEAIKSSTPKICKDAIKKSLDIILNGNEEELKQYVGEFREKFFNSSAEDVSFPRGVSDIDKWRGNPYIKGTPIHVRASIVYNNLLQKMNLTKIYPVIGNRDKMKFMYLKVPNHLEENVIGFPYIFPKEFNLNWFIDYETQFEKSFVAPLTLLLEKINWSLNQRSLTLDECW